MLGLRPMARVMVVDDDDDIRNVVANILLDEGYDVVTARDGQEALELLERMGNEPCIVLLDMVMPRMTGEQLCSRLMHHPRLANVPIIVLAAAHGWKCPGARAYLRKPVSLDTLLKVVAENCPP